MLVIIINQNYFEGIYLNIIMIEEELFKICEDFQ